MHLKILKYVTLIQLYDENLLATIRFASTNPGASWAIVKKNKNKTSWENIAALGKQCFQLL